MPIALTALGRPDSTGLAFLRDVARSLSSGDNTRYSAIIHRIFETISVALCRENAGMMRAFRPTQAHTLNRV
jgi:hypothetical protein